MTDLLSEAPASTALTESFDEFWGRYPRKVGKGAARKAYIKAMKATTHDDIMFALSQQIPSMESKETQFIPHASTWLNGERWADEPEELTGNRNGQDKGASSSLDEARQRAIYAARGEGERGGDWI